MAKNKEKTAPGGINTNPSDNHHVAEQEQVGQGTHEPSRKKAKIAKKAKVVEQLEQKGSVRDPERQATLRAHFAKKQRTASHARGKGRTGRRVLTMQELRSMRLPQQAPGPGAGESAPPLAQEGGPPTAPSVGNQRSTLLGDLLGAEYTVEEATATLNSTQLPTKILSGHQAYLEAEAYTNATAARLAAAQEQQGDRITDLLTGMQAIQESLSTLTKQVERNNREAANDRRLAAGKAKQIDDALEGNKGALAKANVNEIKISQLTKEGEAGQRQVDRLQNVVHHLNKAVQPAQAKRTGHADTTAVKHAATVSLAPKTTPPDMVLETPSPFSLAEVLDEASDVLHSSYLAYVEECAARAEHFQVLAVANLHLIEQTQTVAELTSLVEEMHAAWMEADLLVQQVCSYKLHPAGPMAPAYVKMQKLAEQAASQAWNNIDMAHLCQSAAVRKRDAARRPSYALVMGGDGSGASAPAAGNEEPLGAALIALQPLADKALAEEARTEALRISEAKAAQRAAAQAVENSLRRQLEDHMRATRDIHDPSDHMDATDGKVGNRGDRGHTHGKIPLVPLPSKYSGNNSEDLDTTIFSFETYLEGNHVPREDWPKHAMQLLTGKASEAYMAMALPMQQQGNHPTWDDFRGILYETFVTHDKMLEARAALMTCHQTHSLPSYLQQFRMLLSKAGQPRPTDKDLLLLYWKGLKPEVREAAKINPKTGAFWDTFDDLALHTTILARQHTLSMGQPGIPREPRPSRWLKARLQATALKNRIKKARQMARINAILSPQEQGTKRTHPTYVGDNPHMWGNQGGHGKHRRGAGQGHDGAARRFGRGGHAWQRGTRPHQGASPEWPGEQNKNGWQGQGPHPASGGGFPGPPPKAPQIRCPGCNIVQPPNPAEGEIHKSSPGGRPCSHVGRARAGQ